MGNNTLSTPSILVNNNTISIVPNSFMYDAGEGEINVRAASAGGGNSTSVHSVNAESQIGKPKFDIYLTSEVDAFIASLKQNVGANSIQAIQRFSDGSSVTISFNNQSLINLVEREAGADGVLSLEFAGDQMSGV